MCFPLAIAAADGSNVGANSPAGSPIGNVSPDLLHRIRWANVALAAAVVGTVAIGFWLLLSASSPVLPPDVPRPESSGYAPLAADGGGDASQPGGGVAAGKVLGGGADAAGAGGARRHDGPGRGDHVGAKTRRAGAAGLDGARRKHGSSGGGPNGGGRGPGVGGRSGGGSGTRRITTD